VGSGNLAADRYTNVAAESPGRALAVRFWEITDAPGMKDTLGFVIARDIMHQRQWLTVIKELGGYNALPVLNSFPQRKENQRFSYACISFTIDGTGTPTGR